VKAIEGVFAQLVPAMNLCMEVPLSEVESNPAIRLRK
jgi:hypothetical protein